MKRKILLLEPDYKNKYPPIGLMKIATYHRKLGDEVTFFKGNLKEFALEQVCNTCIDKLSDIDNSFNWGSKIKTIKSFIKGKKIEVLNELELSKSTYQFLLENSLISFADYYRKGRYEKEPHWDRIYVTTLFTFYWKITVKTIKFAKGIVKDIKELKVGGVMASLIPTEIEKETGIKPMEGLLDKPSILDPGNNIIIDDLPLDYSILEEIDYEYPTKSAYFTFMTKGCTRKCAFCSVPKIEPTYKPKIDTLDKYQYIKEKFGEQHNLLLMDNNVLASPKFPEIIQEIKNMGFFKGATFEEPNQLEIVIKNLIEGYNDKAYIKKSFKLLQVILNKRLKKDVSQQYYNILDEYQLLKFETTTKDNILKAYPLISEIYEKYRPKAKQLRYVDFNQGTDARYVTDELMKLMSEIPIRPLRIAFDYLGMKKQYVNAVRLAAKYGINQLSNYILYNFKDSPDEFYERLKINVQLSAELNIEIFSFPMKYIPLFGEESKYRSFVGDKWNKKFIRAVQTVLNVTKGIVASGNVFFEKAFGKNLKEFYDILYMPEHYIMYRSAFEKAGLTHQWAIDFSALDTEELNDAKIIIHKNDFKCIDEKTTNPRILKLLEHYTRRKEDIDAIDIDHKKVMKQYEDLIKKDMFINLTLTYDFEEIDDEELIVA